MPDTLTTNYPIAHWSYSSMMLFLKNRLQFKKQYILNIYDYKSSPAMVVGKGCHAAVEAYWKNTKLSMDKVMEAGLTSIARTPDTQIDYGKTGSREDIIAKFTQAINFYFQELPVHGTTVAVERSMTQFITLSGTDMDLPAKAKVDHLVRDSVGHLGIVDHKFVSSYSDPEADKAEFIMQAMFNYHIIEKEFGEKPEWIIFDELKIGKNKDGSAQRQPYTIVFADHPDYFKFFAQIYIDCSREISKPDCAYLPNLGDMLTGPESFEEYRNGIISIEAPKTVSHRTENRQFVEKQYVPSSADVVDNKFLTNEEKIKSKLLEFGVAVEMQQTFTGPNVILYTLKPSRATKMSSFETYAKDIAIALKAKTIRVEAPIMGTDTVGVEIPNPQRAIVYWDDKYLIPETLNIPIGINVHNEIVNKDLAAMPHLLVAGSTGSGKSVMMNVIVRSLAEQNSAERLKFVLIDPKRVELTQFKNLPHLMCPVIFDEKKASAAIKWLVDEMEVRYDKLEKYNCRSIDDFNRDGSGEIMSKIVVVIDEFADLMLQANDETVESMIVRLAQKARAIGIHLVLGTQRPSVDVVTGLIKANLPTRISFMTTSQTDSRVILDQAGAEALNGAGDMLFQDPSTKGLQRLQGLKI